MTATMPFLKGEDRRISLQTDTLPAFAIHDAEG
jgi:hypothetical protein